MFRLLFSILIGFSLVPAFGQMKSDYQPGTIIAVVARPNTSGDAAASYDVSVQVGNTRYVVLYNPPPGAGTPQYAAGKELLVKVGEKTITFNDMLGQSFDVPIESSSAVEAPVRKSSTAEPPQVPTKSTLVMGLPGFKDNSNGSLTVEKASLHFVHSKNAVDIPAPSITDLVTGGDSQRVIRGTAGTVSMFGPYGSGRFLSLFRSKLDTLTLQYRDADGGLHGSIFTMAVGQAELVKQQLIAEGAHTTVKTENSGAQERSKLSESTEQKP